MLKVSEASLRRWTNAGRLACLRLGAKGEIWLIVGIVIVVWLVNWAIARFVQQLRGTAIPVTPASTQQLLLLRVVEWHLVG